MMTIQAFDAEIAVRAGGRAYDLSFHTLVYGVGCAHDRDNRFTAHIHGPKSKPLAWADGATPEDVIRQIDEQIGRTVAVALSDLGEPPEAAPTTLPTGSIAAAEQAIDRVFATAEELAALVYDAITPETLPTGTAPTNAEILDESGARR